MTEIRSNKSSRVQDRRNTTNKAATPGLYPKAKPVEKGLSYTRSPAVPGARPGKAGGVWRDSSGKVLGTAKSETARVRPVKQRVKGQSPRRTS